jgi:enoyl-CoA hydratase/carnithine racemase
MTGPRPDLSVVEDGDLLSITLQRPERANALSTGMLQGVVEAIARANAEPRTSAIVLTGAGARHFSAGIDLREDFPAGLDPVSERRRWLTATLLAVIDSEKPVIAAVNGACIGAGVLLAFVSDGIVASRGAVFALPEVKVGMAAPIPAAIVAATIGPGFLNRLVLAGHPLDAEEVHRAGLAQPPCDAEELRDRTGEQARALGSQPRQAFAPTKAWARRGLREQILAAARHADSLSAERRTSPAVELQPGENSTSKVAG